jgi:oxygen-dependent protoporphyrinogen oxidase
MAMRIIVVGGGISGLAASHRLMEISRERHLNLEITMVEAGQRLGGSISTEQVDGFLVEAGPDSFISEKPWALQLCERLGITSRLLPLQTTRQNLYVVHRGSLHPLPEGFILMAPTRLWPMIRSPLFSWSGKLRMALDLILPRRGHESDESLASFVRRRFGSEVLERVAQPLIGGIYAADPEELSVAATLPRFLEMERSGRSIIWATLQERRRRSHAQRGGSGARWSLFVSFANGMQELVDTLANRLPEGTTRLGTKAVGLARNPAQGWIVTTDRGEELDAHGVILALPAYGAAKSLSSLAPELSKELQAIPYTSAATVSLAYRREEIPAGLDGFGLVVPAVEGRKIIACSFSSVKYPGRAPVGFEMLRAFVGGALQSSLLEQSDHAMETGVRQELATLLGIQAPPLFCRIHRHPNSMPQYLVGHLDRVRRIETHRSRFPGLALAGSAYRGVGIPDCIHSGEEAAESVLNDLAKTDPL